MDLPKMFEVSQEFKAKMSTKEGNNKEDIYDKMRIMPGFPIKCHLCERVFEPEEYNDYYEPHLKEKHGIDTNKEVK